MVASAIARIQVEKRGFERAIAEYSREYSFLCGLMAVALSFFMGWLAGRLFAYV